MIWTNVTERPWLSNSLSALWKFVHREAKTRFARLDKTMTSPLLHRYQPIGAFLICGKEQLNPQIINGFVIDGAELRDGTK